MDPQGPQTQEVPHLTSGLARLLPFLLEPWFMPTEVPLRHHDDPELPQLYCLCYHCYHVHPGSPCRSCRSYGVRAGESSASAGEPCMNCRSVATRRAPPKSCFGRFENGCCVLFREKRKADPNHPASNFRVPLFRSQSCSAASALSSHGSHQSRSAGDISI